MKECVRIFRCQDSQYAGDVLIIEAERTGRIIGLFERLYCSLMAIKLVWKVTK